MPLPNAPAGNPTLPSNLTLESNLLAWAPGTLDTQDDLSITATLDPSPVNGTSPTLGCIEVQYTCTDIPDADAGMVDTQ